jgi:penicillin-binding protein 1A
LHKRLTIAALLFLPVLPELQQHELAGGVDDVTRVERSALGLAPPQAPVVVEENATDPEAIVGPEDPVGDVIEQAPQMMDGTLEGMGLQMKMGRDGSISITPGRDREPQPPPRDPREPRTRDDEGGEGE